MMRETAAEKVVEETELTQEIRKEYDRWNKEKGLTRIQKQIHVKERTKEQIYQQIKRITEYVVASTEKYLAECMCDGDNGSDNGGSGNSDSTDNDNGVLSNDDNNNNNNNNNEDENEETSTTISNEVSVNDIVGDENDNSNYDNEEISTADSSHSYNSEEKEELLHYLENDCSTEEPLNETARETLRRIDKM